jgi:acyl carrier protein
LKEKLPDYLVPSAIVELEKMPLTPNGKLDRKALPRPEQERGSGAGVEAAAQTPVEEIVIGIFEEVLKVDQAGRSDNFFEIGGHSLLATRAVSRMRDAFGVEIGVRSIFEEPTVAGLARRIEEALKAGKQSAAPPLTRTRRTGDGAARLPLSFAQQRLWFLDQLVPNNPIYNCPLAVKLEGRLNLEALERAINEVIRRHEVLRTRFELEGDQPAQVIEEWKPRRLEVVDLTDRDPKEAEAEAGRIAQEEAKTGFDLSRGPLLRVKILKLEEERHALVITLHHIVSDAWSTGILVREMSLLYEAMSNGQESPLPELDIQYADYASWQRSYLTDEVLEEHLRYWKQQLSGKLPVVNLAGALQPRARPEVRTYRGASKSIPLPAELSKSLKALSRQEGATLFMLLLAAFKTLLYRYTAQSDLVLGVSMGNRDRAEIEPLIGFFINMLPMRTDLSGNPRFTQLLKRVKEVALGAYAHQETPFDKLVEEIQPERDLGQMPLFNIVFGVQNAPKGDARASGLELSPMIADNESARFDLTLWIDEGPESIYGRWIYSIDLFEEETILRMHGHLETLLSSIVARPDAPLDELEMFSEAEKSQRTASRAVREKYHSNRFESVKPKAIAILDE